MEKNETIAYSMKPIARIHTDFPAKFGVPRQAGLVPELTGVERFNFLPLPEDSVCEGFAAGTQDYIFGWVYNRRLLYDFPAQAEYLKFSDTGWRGEFNLPLDAGFFSCEIYDTLNGQLRAVGQIFHSGGCLKLDLPPFQADAAFKLKRINYVE